jgi:hypothetical protein
MRSRGRTKGWVISNIDATGQLGNRLTQRCNIEKAIELSVLDLEMITREDGQIIDLKAQASEKGSCSFEVIVQDGVSIDVIGRGPMPTREA